MKIFTFILAALFFSISTLTVAAPSNSVGTASAGAAVSDGTTSVAEVSNKSQPSVASLPPILVEPYVITGNLIFISGQVPLENGKVKYTGKVGDTATEEQGKAAAKLAAENVLAILKSALGGSLDKVKRCVKVSGYVNATPDFTGHSQIINGASKVFIDALGEKGKHARIAIGVASLPLGATAEVDAIFEIER